MTVRVDQSGAAAGGDNVGRDKVTNNFVSTGAAGTIELLLEKLQLEIESSQHTRDVIERLQRFYRTRAPDGVVGLQAKLAAAGRDDIYEDALEMKEMFAKLLEQWSLYLSAQKIFVFLLARAERQFNDIIYPQMSAIDRSACNQLVHNLIVAPTIDDCGASVFEVDENVAMGLIYWLAEQCFIRWH